MPEPKKIKILFCINDRGEGRRSCAASGANVLRKYAKDTTADDDRIKIRKSKCLGMCKQGPVLQLLPSKTCYRYDSPADIDAILNRQVARGEVVKSLLLKIGKSAKKK